MIRQPGAKIKKRTKKSEVIKTPHPSAKINKPVDPNMYWRNGYVRKDGTIVRGQLVKKPKKERKERSDAGKTRKEINQRKREIDRSVEQSLKDQGIPELVDRLNEKFGWNLKLEKR